MKKIILILITLILISTLTAYANTGGAEGLTTVRGKVVEVIADMGADDLGADISSPVQGRQVVKVLVKEGEYEGKEFIVENNLGGMEFFNIRVEKGDSILLMLDETSGTINVNISGFVRDRYILYTVLLFVTLLILVGRVKGLKAVVTLAVTILIIWKYLLPTILTGVSSEEAVMLMYLPNGVQFDFKGLLFAGIIIGTLGAVMDVSISIASSMDEVKKANKEISKLSLIKSGMNVGKDIMGTMTNTLILAYTGASIPIMLVFMAYNTSMVEVINLDIIATEIIRAITGSIGIVLAIPFTAFFAGLLE